MLSKTVSAEEFDAIQKQTNVVRLDYDETLEEVGALFVTVLARLGIEVEEIVTDDLPAILYHIKTERR